jgi:hypothetical protein
MGSGKCTSCGKKIEMEGLIQPLADADVLVNIALAAGAGAGSLWLLHKIKRLHSIKKRPNRAAGETEGWRIALAAAIVLAVVAGSIGISALILGVGMASLGWLALAMICTLVSAGILVGLVALVFRLINGKPKNQKEKLGFGCFMVLMTIVVFVPAALFAGAGLNLLFLSLFLSMPIVFWTAMLVWACCAALLLGGYFGFLQVVLD